jgi:hypothetical protein
MHRKQGMIHHAEFSEVLDMATDAAHPCKFVIVLYEDADLRAFLEEFVPWAQDLGSAKETVLKWHEDRKLEMLLSIQRPNENAPPFVHDLAVYVGQRRVVRHMDCLYWWAGAWVVCTFL